MPLDSSIPLSFRLPQTETPFQHMDQALTLRKQMLMQEEAERARQRSIAFDQEIASIPPEQRTQEKLVEIGMKYAGPKELVQYGLQSLDNKEKNRTNQQLAFTRLQQDYQFRRANLDVAQRNATTNEQRAQIAAAVAQLDQQYKMHQSQIAAGKHLYETGMNIPAPDMGGVQVPQTPQVAPQPTQEQPGGINIQSESPSSRINLQGATYDGVRALYKDANTPQEIKEELKKAVPRLAQEDAQPQGVPAARMSPKKADEVAAEQAKDKNKAEIEVVRDVQKKVTKALEENYNRLKDAPQQIANIEKAKTLIPSATTFQGSLAEQKLAIAKFFNNNLGLKIDVEGVQSAEELRSRIFMNVMDNLKKMDAQPSQLQQQIMQDALGKLGTDPGALPRILDAFADTIKDKVSSYDRQVQEATTVGVQWPHKIEFAKPAAKPSGDPRSVTLKNGKVYQFPSPGAAEEFRKKARERGAID